jgi:superfamily II DNA or RNA helicase
MQLRPHQEQAIQSMTDNDKGQVIVPTGGGKTICMIMDAVKQLEDYGTVVVVAPRILLAEQLCKEFMEIIDKKYNDVDVMHVHSGKIKGIFSSTNPFEIQQFVEQNSVNFISRTIIFTTYHSLHRVQESGIDVDTIYFDEAHNSVQKNFFPATDYFSQYAGRCYFFTATPKHSRTPFKVGMNDADVYGQVICNVPAPKLVKQGYILPPKVKVFRSRILKKDELVAERDNEQMVGAIDNLDKNKVLICAKSTRQIIGLISQTDFVQQLAIRGYSYMFITSKTGAMIDGEKVDRETFFDTLNDWGRTNKKFVVLHHSILSEGINVNGLEAVLFMRSMDYIGISQTIGRVIRKGDVDKVFGLVCVPVYSNVGITTARKVEAVVDTIFNKGEAATTVITR